MIENTGSRTLKTTRTSLRILTLVLEHEGLTLAQLDEMIESPKSSILSHLNTLRDSRYLVKSDGTYRVSFRVALLGETVRSRYPSRERVRTVLEELAERTGEEANFTIFEHGRLLMFHGTSGNAATEEDEADYRSEYYLHNTAAGKAILSEIDSARVDRILEKWGLPRESEATITDREQLFNTLEETAERGYGIVDEEFAPGLVAVGAAVHRDDGTILGGLSVGGPKYRVDRTRIDQELGDQLLDAVQSLESSLQSQRVTQ
ncbi:IclR family transcriptional regulator [Haloarcula japonica]|uniref:ArcR family transcription regulator n=1 Tax=Haloarcula japonica (strain ATCC 49778 / DSM 6131 / JCM 7785 / NBRC 101032 / NCIMB 13157 / TR-1) TaxID=1227453 RepID=M0LIP7_HALJT|nr:IclR family transcriptional regulator [Haloarcula japonica]EMA33487.1 ArcR family transcription regulator [Haloarcula japonica DSM 6131]